MAGLTFREAARKKILRMALAAGCAFLILFAIALRFQLEGLAEHHAPAFIRKQVLNNGLMLGLYAIDLLAVVLTVMTSVDTLSGEIESGTIQAIATKPVHRWQLLAGKWLGFAAMLVLYLLLMVGGLNVVSYVLAPLFATLHRVSASFAWKALCCSRSPSSSALRSRLLQMVCLCWDYMASLSWAAG
jgi:ABC-type transport system involved in multi-copper enzyme maturation permease subunit